MTSQTKKIKDILGEFFLIPKKDNHSQEIIGNGSPNQSLHTKPKNNVRINTDNKGLNDISSGEIPDTRKGFEDAILKRLKSEYVFGLLTLDAFDEVIGKAISLSRKETEKEFKQQFPQIAFQDGFQAGAEKTKQEILKVIDEMKKKEEDFTGFECRKLDIQELKQKINGGDE